MVGLQVVVQAELLPGFYQQWVEFQAGQALLWLQQAPAQMALVGAPVEPVARCIVEVQVVAEGFDLLPLAPGHVDIQAGGRHWQVGCG
ncbi:hypothetical protein D3C72_1855870 [compost metagenome]